MYHSPNALQPEIEPEGYFCPEHFASECAHVFSDSWHLVGTRGQLLRSGDYVSALVLDVPVLVRNFGGELVALHNVCAHRHAQLVCKQAGHSPSLKCPYHGWEYGADGLTRKIPVAKNFPQFDRQTYCLDRFVVDTCGELVFIRLTAEGLSLSEWLGQRAGQFADWFSQSSWKQTLLLNFEYPCNWKIPIEAALESYHIPSVHPNSFAEDPGESRSEHFFYDTGTSFKTIFMTPRVVDHVLKAAEQLTMSALGVPFTGFYEHHQVFPNLLISHTDSLSLAQVVIPRTPTTASGLVIQFGRRSARSNPISRLTSWGWGHFATWLTRPILYEDVRIYPKVQAGVKTAPRPGLLGRCEERLHASQHYIKSRIEGRPHVANQPPSQDATPVHESTPLEFATLGHQVNQA